MGALKKNPDGAGKWGGGSSFLSFWLGFILSGRERNMHCVFHIKTCTVFVLTLDVIPACSAKDLLVTFTQPQSQRNGALKEPQRSFKKDIRIKNMPFFH